MESDIDISKFVRTLSFYKRIKNIADKRPSCINVQTTDEVSDDEENDVNSDVTEIDGEENDVRNVEFSINADDDDDDEETIGGELNNNNTDKVRRHLPPGTGQFSVGCVDIMDNDSEEGSFFRLFYPVEKTDILKRNTQWPLWLPRKEYGHGYAIFLKKAKFFGKLFNWIGGDVYIPALWCAPLVQSDRKFPLIVMSHGIGGNRTTYSTFCLELASHGFIVAVPEHRDGSASMTYMLKDNMRRTVVEQMKDHESDNCRIHSAMHRSSSFQEEWRSFEHTDPMGIPWDDFEYRNKQVHHRAEECKRLVDLIADIDNGRSIRNFLGFHFSLKQFKGRIDMSKVAFAGHSFGGSTCVTTLGLDSRFKVGLMLDAWMHPVTEELCSKVTQPVLMLNFENFQWKRNVEQMKWLSSDTVDRPQITLKGACHQAMSDFQFIVSKPFGKLMEVRSEISAKAGMEVCNRAAVSFLAKHFGLKDIQVDEKVLKGHHDLLASGLTYKLEFLPEATL